MIVEYIRYTLTDHEASDLVQAYSKAAASLREAPECVDFELAQCEEEPASFILRIRWISTEAHLGGFRKGPHFGEFLSAIREFIPEIKEMRHYQQTSVIGTGGAERAGSEA